MGVHIHSAQLTTVRYYERLPQILEPFFLWQKLYFLLDQILLGCNLVEHYWVNFVFVLPPFYDGTFSVI